MDVFKTLLFISAIFIGVIPAFLLSFLGTIGSLIVTAAFYAFIFYRFRKEKYSRPHFVALAASCLIMLSSLMYVGSNIMVGHDAQLAIAVSYYSGLGLLTSLLGYFIAYYLAKFLIAR